ncbi:TPA: outer membrane beta-barrel protein [Vibrio vulnificus]
MKRKTLTTVALLLTLSAAAHANSFGKYSYIGVGLQYSEQKNDSLGSFLGSEYDGKGARDLFGINFTGSYSPTTLDMYVKYEFEGTTSGNTDISSSFAGLGGYNNFNTTSLFYTVGVSKYDVEREYSSREGSARFREFGPAADLGASFQLAPFFALTPRYRISYLDHDVMNDYKLTGQFMFGSTFSLEVSAGYNTYRDSEQFNGQTAVKFAF